MKGAILEKGERYYTHMNKVFHAIENKQLQYNWFITDCDCCSMNEATSLLLMPSKGYAWITGEQLTQIVKDEDFQWVWAVLSGFKKSVALEEVLKYKFPYADGYEGFWKAQVSIQHPLADIEIVPWDSGLVLVISKEDEIINSFMSNFSLAEDLETYNKRFIK